MPRLFALNFRSGLLIGFAVAIAVAAAAIAYERYDTQTLKRTLRRDAVLCGVNTGLPGFSSADDKGNWSGFDVDFCRAVAAAIFDDPTKVKFISLDVISKEPLAPVVRQKDDDWFLIVKWTFHAMVNAEELGITSQNIDAALKSTKPDVMRFVGTEGTYGEELGLTKDWAVRIIRHVGNYGEVYERN